MTLTVRLTEKDKKLIEKYAQMNHMTASAFIRQAALERIENEYDLAIFDEAIAEFEKNPVAYTLDEVKEELGL
jgi:uncharacterized protein (DUF1778 family)